MCDTLCVRTPAGMLFAKNSDRHPDEAQVVEWHAPRPAGGELRTQYLTIPDAGAFALVGSRPTWLWGFEHGVNEHGVAIGNEKIWTTTRARDLPPALLGMDLVRLGLERGRTADDALDVMTALLEQHGQGGSGEPHRDEPYFSSFLVADARGGWVLETSGRTWAAKPGRVTARRSRTASRSAATGRAARADVAARRRLRHVSESAMSRRRSPMAGSRRRGSAIAPDASPRRLAATLRDHGAGDPTRRHHGVHAPTRGALVHDRVDDRRAAATTRRARMGVPRQSVHERLRADLPARRLAGARRQSCSGSASRSCAIASTPIPGSGPRPEPSSARSRPSSGTPPTPRTHPAIAARLDRFGREAYAPIDQALRGLGV